MRVAGYFGYADCVDKVLARCQDPEESVRAAALEHLPYFDDARCASGADVGAHAMTSRGHGRQRRARSERSTKVRRRKLLAQALNDTDSWVRYFAVMGLGRHGDPAWLDALVERARNDEAVHVARRRGRRHCCGRQRRRRRGAGSDEPAGRRPRPRGRCAHWAAFAAMPSRTRCRTRFERQTRGAG